jgi:hypothetical protein
MQTLRKLPMQAPKTKAAAGKNQGKEAWMRRSSSNVIIGGD